MTWKTADTNGGSKLPHTAALLPQAIRSYYVAAIGLLAVCLFVLGFGRLAQAQSPAYIERPTVLLKLGYQHKDEQRVTAGGQEQEEVTTTLRERLEVYTGGWIYHPGLLNYRLGLQPEWRQENQEEQITGVEQDTDTTFLGYFIDSTFLQYRPYTVKFYSGRSRNEFDSTLAPSHITETELTRLSLLLKHKLLPTTLTYERNKTDFENFFSSTYLSDIYRIETNHENDRSRSQFRAELLKQEREVNESRTELDRRLVSFINAFDFTENWRLSSYLYWSDSDSDFIDQEIITWSERLNVDHRKNLRSEYRFRWDQRDQEDFESDRYYLFGGLTHDWRDRLTTDLNASMDQNTFTGGEINFYQTNLDFHYRRPIPGGTWTLTNGYGYRYEDNNVEADTIRIIGEPYVVESDNFLNNINILDSTIEVRDENQVLLTLGPDYNIVEVGDLVAIIPGASDAIELGSQVFVTYEYLPQLPFTSGTGMFRLGTELNFWQRWRLYYNFFRAKENLMSGVKPTDLQDDTIHRLGTEYKWQWTTTTLEYEDRDTTVSPLTRWRFRERLAFHIQPRMSLSLTGQYQETDLVENDDLLKSLYFSGLFRWQLRRRTDFDVNAYWRRIEGNFQNTRSNGIVSRLTWRYGDWLAIARAEWLDEEDEFIGQSRERQLVRFDIERRFW